MKSYKIFLFIPFLLFSSCLFSNYDVNDTIIPLKNFYPTANGDTIVEHTYYTISYSFKNKNPEWTIYEYNNVDLNIERNHTFSEDPKIKNTATNKDYLKSNYDRGHLVPAEDMDFNEKAMDESFYLSNISPQNPNFNRGIWKKLENYVRHLGKTKELIVISGSLISKTSKTIGNGVKIPSHFYKIIYIKNTNETICFLIPNSNVNESLGNYTIKLSELEKKTSIDFK
jgi:endonuclease G